MTAGARAAAAAPAPQEPAAAEQPAGPAPFALDDDDAEETLQQALRRAKQLAAAPPLLQRFVALHASRSEAPGQIICSKVFAFCSMVLCPFIQQPSAYGL